MDYFLNGQGFGGVADVLMAHNGDVKCLRPWLGNDGKTYMTVNNGYDKDGNPLYRAQLVHNATATLRKNDWILLDRAVIDVARNRLRAVADLRAANLVYNIPNGMSKTSLEYQSISDITGATMSMDGIRRSESDRPTFDLVGLPLPIIHKDFEFSARQVMVSRNGGSPLDTTMAELAARKVAEAAEDLLIGNTASYSFAGGTIYGYTNFPHSIAKTLTAPTAGGWIPSTLLAEILDMKQKSMDVFHYGPWMLYTAPNWDKYLDDDFSAAKGQNTLRQRIEAVNGISSVRTLDRLTNYDMLLVQTSSDVVREVIGMDVTTVQWQSHGGMQLNFKVMCIMVPQLRADQNGNSGIVYGAV